MTDDESARPEITSAQSVLLVDAHPIVTTGLGHLLGAEPDIHIVGKTTSASEAQPLLERERPHLVVLGLSEEVAPEARSMLHTLLAASPETPVLLFSSLDERNYAPTLLREGARGYVHKAATEVVILEAVRKLLAGGSYMSPLTMQGLLHSLLQSSSEPGIAGGLTRLTETERAVLQHLSRGEDTAEIARALGITRKTAQTHRRNVQRKLGLSNSSAVVHYATELRLSRLQDF